MSKCGTCKHFNPDPPKKSHRIDFGYCGRIKEADSYDKESRKDELAVTEDGSDYYSALLCKSDFGCVLHQPK